MLVNGKPITVKNPGVIKTVEEVMKMGLATNKTSALALLTRTGLETLKRAKSLPTSPLPEFQNTSA